MKDMFDDSEEMINIRRPFIYAKGISVRYVTEIHYTNTSIHNRVLFSFSMEHSTHW